VTPTVAELLEGSDFAFDDRGEHELKGTEGSRQLCAARGSAAAL
jgi:hypothetical protein